jgi:hypothetical protein
MLAPEVSCSEENCLPVTDVQLYLAIGVPVILNTVALTLLAAHMNSRFDAVNQRFDAVNQRFDDMRDLWRTELHRVEESWTHV